MRSFWFHVVACFTLSACGGNAPDPATANSVAEQPSADSDPSSAETTGEADSSAAAPVNPNTRSAAAAGNPSASDSSGSDEENSEFALKDSTTARSAHGATESKIRATRTEAAVKFFVVDKEKGPIPGIVISLTSPQGAKLVTPETDVTGYTEVLVPVGQKYELVYLSLGRQDIAATVPVPDEPNQNIKLTLRYKRFTEPPRLVLDGVNFDTGKATLRPDSHARLDRVAEFLTYKKSARVEISGHTDNVGNAKNNKSLSEKRAQACRDYLISRGIDGSRIEARGYGDERPIASNDSDAGRQLNRRIEAQEL